MGLEFHRCTRIFALILTVCNSDLFVTLSARVQMLVQVIRNRFNREEEMNSLLSIKVDRRWLVRITLSQKQTTLSFSLSKYKYQMKAHFKRFRRRPKPIITKILDTSGRLECCLTNGF